MYRVFPFGGTSGDTSTVQDQDITQAILEASAEINTALFPSQEIYTTYYNYLAAHKLIMMLRYSSQGIAGQYPWFVQSKGVGGVSQSSYIPEWVQRNPYWLALSTTYPGLTYILYVGPLQSVGVCFSVTSQTNP